MVDPTPVPAVNAVADPKKPVKAWVALAISLAIIAVPVIQSLQGDGWSTADTLAVIFAVLQPLAVYLAPNPIVSAQRANGL